MRKKRKKISKKFLQDKKTWNKHHEKILENIKNGKNTLTELEKDTGLSRTTILKHLDDMREKHLLERKLVPKKLNQRGGGKRKIFYIITEKGIINLNEIKIHREYLNNKEKSGSSMFYDYSELETILCICSLPWGIDSHLIINKKLEKIKILKREDVEEIERLLYEKLVENIKYIREYQLKFRSESLKLLEEDEFLLGFKINLDKIHKSIKKKSLERFDNMTDEEIDSCLDSDNAIAELSDDSVLDR